MAAFTSFQTTGAELHQLLTEKLVGTQPSVVHCTSPASGCNVAVWRAWSLASGEIQQQLEGAQIVLTDAGKTTNGISARILVPPEDGKYYSLIRNTGDLISKSMMTAALPCNTATCCEPSKAALCLAAIDTTQPFGQIERLSMILGMVATVIAKQTIQLDLSKPVNNILGGGISYLAWPRANADTAATVLLTRLTNDLTQELSVLAYGVLAIEKKNSILATKKYLCPANGRAEPSKLRRTAFFKISDNIYDSKGAKHSAYQIVEGGRSSITIKVSSEIPGRTLTCCPAFLVETWKSWRACLPPFESAQDPAEVVPQLNDKELFEAVSTILLLSGVVSSLR